MNERIKDAAFINQKLKDAYLQLKEGKFEEKKLFDSINKYIQDLKRNPQCGIRIPNRLIPKEYLADFQVTNL